MAVGQLHGMFRLLVWPDGSGFFETLCWLSWDHTCLWVVDLRSRRREKGARTIKPHRHLCLGICGNCGASILRTETFAMACT